MGFEPPGYRVLRQVGTGAASRIYMAKQLSSGKTVAIKHVNRATPDDDKFIKQVENEFAISSRLNHRFLRRSYEIHRVRKLLSTREVVVVMEYVEGLPIEKALPNRLDTFLKLFRRVAEGLDAMHEAGFVHSDIKPTNIMLAQGGVVKIIDFGQACRMNHRKERIQGTPDYIAPEQVRRMPLDRRTDVFNLGATMYWVLTTQNYPTVISAMEQRVGRSRTKPEKPVAPIELNDKIPLALSTLVMECCREKPDDRPSDMKQVAARLAVVQKLWTQYRESIRMQRQESNNQPSAEDVATGAGEEA